MNLSQMQALPNWASGVDFSTAVATEFSVPYGVQTIIANTGNLDIFVRIVGLGGLLARGPNDLRITPGNFGVLSKDANELTASVYLPSENGPPAFFRVFPAGPGVYQTNGVPLRANKPLYFDGDSLAARSNREEGLTAFTVINNVITFTPGGIGPNGAAVRLYGFQDERLNCEGRLIADSVSTRMVLPIPVPDGDQTTYVARAGGSQRSYNVATLQSDCGLMAWACMLAGKRWNWFNRAQGGRRSADIRADFVSNFAGLPPGVILMESGVNTIKSGETVQQAEDNYSYMIAMALFLGHEVILTTPTTFSSVFAGYAATNQGLFQQAASMRKLAQLYNVDLCDLQAIWVNGLSTDGQPVVGYVDTSDGIHWTGTFAKAAAPTLNAILDRRGVGFTPVPILTNIADCAYTPGGAVLNAANTNKLRNAQMFGTTGSGAPNVPDGWTLTLTGATTVNTKLASPLNAADGLFRMTLDGVNGNNFLLQSTTFHTDCTPGKRVRAGGRARMSISNQMRVAFGLLATINGKAGTQIVAINSVSAGLGGNYGDVTFNWMTPDWDVPADGVVTAITLIIQGVWSATAAGQIFESSQNFCDVFTPPLPAAL